MSLRTPLSRVQGLGSARSGTEHWWLERVTGLANLPLNLFLAGFIVMHLGGTRAGLIESVRNPIVAGLLVLSFIAMLWHMKLGMRVIIEDYVHNSSAKFALLIANSGFILALGTVAIYAILKMSFAS